MIIFLVAVKQLVLNFYLSSSTQETICVALTVNCKWVFFVAAWTTESVLSL